MKTALSEISHLADDAGRGDLGGGEGGAHVGAGHGGVHGGAGLEEDRREVLGVDLG